jgi:hypothetical protein
MRGAASRMRQLPVVMHPHAPAFGSQAIGWARSRSLVGAGGETSRAAAIRIGELAGLVFARERRDEVIRLGADLMLWLYLFDDRMGEAPAELAPGEHREILGTYERVVRKRALVDRPGPFHVALLELVRRAERLGATDDWLERFAGDVAAYLSGCAEETPYRRANVTPSVDDYRRLRARTIGTPQVFALIELGRSTVVPAEEMRRPDVVEARRMAALLTAWVNDIYSYPNELAAGDPLNLVIALAGNRLRPDEALAEAVELYNAELADLERIVEGIRASDGSRALATYLDGLLDWVHGNCAWTELCGRYR